MKISRQFKIALYGYRADGGACYRLAIAHRLSPSTFSAMLSGLRRILYADPRIIAIGAELGLHPDECFEAEPDDLSTNECPVAEREVRA